MNCLFCNSELNTLKICSDTNHYFYLNNDVNCYTISYLIIEDIEILLHFRENEYNFYIIKNTDCIKNGEQIFNTILDEKEYFKIYNLDINKIKDHLEMLYQLNIFM